MAGRKDTERGLPYEDWLRQQLLLPPDKRAPDFKRRLYPRLMVHARNIASRLQGNTDPQVARDMDELFLDAAKGVRFAGRSEGEKTKHIRELMQADPDLRPLELFRKANGAIIGNMAFKTFENRVSEIRKEDPLSAS